MRKVLAIATVLLLVQNLPLHQTASACTIGAAARNVTADGRPLLWKSRGAGIYNFVVFCDDGDYDFIGVKNDTNEGVMMGLNLAGLATGNSSVTTPGLHPHSTLQANLLGSCETVYDAADFIQDAYDDETLVASTCLPFIDADGNAIMIEVWCELPINGGQHHLYYYNTRTRNRYFQALPLGNMYGWIVRANEWHYHDDHCDSTAVYNAQGRYYDGVLIVRDLLNPLTPTQLTAPMLLNEFLRDDDIAVGNVCSSIVVHGVLPTENPGLSTMWTALGHPDHAIAAPLWVEAGYIPGPMEDQAEPIDGSLLANLADTMRSLGYNPAQTQASVIPQEQHFFEEVEELMTRWRLDYSLAQAHMARVQEAFASNAYTLLTSIYGFNPHTNHAPTNDIAISCVAPDPSSPVIYRYPLYRFDAYADDLEGDIVHYRWDFGDDSDCNIDAPTVYHRYRRAGWYLVSCTVEDEHGATTTDFIYLHNISYANDTPVAAN